MYINNFLISARRTLQDYTKITKANFVYFVVNALTLLVLLPLMGYYGLYISTLFALVASLFILNGKNDPFFAVADLNFHNFWGRYKKQLVMSSIRLKYIEFPLSLSAMMDMLFAKSIFAFADLSIYATSKSVVTSIKKTLSWLRIRQIIKTYELTNASEETLTQRKRVIIKVLVVDNLVLIPLLLVGAYWVSYYVFSTFFIQYIESVHIIPLVGMSLYYRGIQEQYRSLDFARKRFTTIRNANLLGLLVTVVGFVLFYLLITKSLVNMALVFSGLTFFAAGIVVFYSSTYTWKEKLVVLGSMILPTAGTLYFML
jgi:hypothetical protein